MRCRQEPHIPIYFGGSSDMAVQVAARHADVYAMWGEPLEAARRHIERVKAAAAAHGRTPGISLSLRPILAATEERAWGRAYDILARPRGDAGGETGRFARRSTGSIGSRRLLERPRTPATCTTPGCSPRSPPPPARPATRLHWSGTPEQVAESMLAYIEIGVTTLLIRGYDPYDDAAAYGELIDLVREEVARRERSSPP